MQNIESYIIFWATIPSFQDISWFKFIGTVETQLTELQRLDLTAKALGNDGYFVRSRLSLTVLSGFFLLELVFADTASMKVVTSIACVGTVLCWLRWRYSVFALPVVVIAVGLGMLLSREFPGSRSGWQGGLAYFPFFAYMAYWYWDQGKTYSTVQGKAWNQERAEVQKLIDLLKNPSDAGSILEFSSGSLWTGYFTYRFLKADNYWIVARFKTGQMRRMLECRVRGPAAIQIVQNSSGELSVQIDGHRIPRVKTSPEMRASILATLSAQ
jgi:hypothetical protein